MSAAGKYRHKLGVYANGTAVDAMGAPVNPRPTSKGTLIGEIWAAVEPGQGQENFKEGVTVAGSVFAIKYRAPRSFAITTSCWFQWGTRRFDILDIGDMEERGIEAVATCREVTEVG
jgi:head-tail adaptor